MFVARADAVLASLAQMPARVTLGYTNKKTPILVTGGDDTALFTQAEKL